MRDAAYPVVTILMPVFNGQDHLREAVDSILGQTFSSFELLVVNDGSTDASADILADYAAKDERVRVVYQPNSGIVGALNVGLTLAKGVYIARMDADDVAYQKRLEIQVAYMEAHPNCVACGSDYELIGARSGRVRTPRTNVQCQARLLIASCFAQPTVMLRAAILRSANLYYETEFQHAEDYRLWTQLSQYGDPANIPEVLLSYRVHSAQISKVKQRLQREMHSVIAAIHLTRNGLHIDEVDVRNVLWGEDDYKYEFFSNVYRKILVERVIYNSLSGTLRLRLYIYKLIAIAAVRSFFSRLRIS